MKKIIILLLLLTIPAGLFAFDTYMGVKAGVNLGWFSGSEWDNYIESTESSYGLLITEKPNVSFHIGAFGEVMFTNNLGAVIELNYSQYGQDYEYTYYGYTFNGEYTQDSVQIPLLLKLAANKDKGVYLLLGPVVNFLIGDMEFEESGAGYKVSGSAEPDNTVVWGAMGGLGYSWNLRFGRAHLEARYSRNLTDAFDDDAFDINGIQILGGLSFRV